MPNPRAGFALDPIADLFGSEPDNQITDPEKMVQEIPLGDIEGFAKHPFMVRDDNEMRALVESVKADGVIAPVLVRPVAGKYQLVSGHRRRHAAELAGLDTIPAIVREMTDDEATIAMVDSNLQREKILSSERAWAYRLKQEAMKHQGRVLSDGASESAAVIGDATGESARTVYRYIRLTYLIPALLCLVDSEKISMSEAVRLSYLHEDEQHAFLWKENPPKPERPPKPRMFKVSSDRLERYFKPDDKPQYIEEIIERALAAWFERDGGNANEKD